MTPEAQENKMPQDYSARIRNPGTAAVLSALLPGLGQIYNGTFWRALLWLLITPGLWLGTGGLLGWLCHVVAAVTAYNFAQRHPYH